MKWMANKITGVGRCLLLTLWESASIGKDGSFHCGICGLGSLVSIRVRDREKVAFVVGLLAFGKRVWYYLWVFQRDFNDRNLRLIVQ